MVSLLTGNLPVTYPALITLFGGRPTGFRGLTRTCLGDPPPSCDPFCAISLLSDMCSLNLHNNDNDNNNNKRHKWKNAKGMVVHCFCAYGGGALLHYWGRSGE